MLFNASNPDVRRSTRYTTSPGVPRASLPPINRTSGATTSVGPDFCVYYSVEGCMRPRVKFPMRYNSQNTVFKNVLETPFECAQCVSRNRTSSEIYHKRECPLELRTAPPPPNLKKEIRYLPYLKVLTLTIALIRLVRRSFNHYELRY